MPRSAFAQEGARDGSLSSSTCDLPTSLALRLEERVGHRAADEERVDAAEQVLEHRDLVGDLGAAEHGHVRPLDVAEQLAEELDLLRSIRKPGALLAART